MTVKSGLPENLLTIKVKTHALDPFFIQFYYSTPNACMIEDKFFTCSSARPLKTYILFLFFNSMLPLLVIQLVELITEGEKNGSISLIIVYFVLFVTKESNTLLSLLV